MIRKSQDIIGDIKRQGFAILGAMSLSTSESNLIGNTFSLIPTQPLYHYLPIGRFQSLIESHALYLRRIDCFEKDNLEGKIPQANHTEVSSLGVQLMEQIGLTKKFIENRNYSTDHILRKFTYVHCWFGNETEDQDMWTNYGDGGKGVCIKTTAQRLQEAIGNYPQNLTVQIFPVTYSDEETPIPEIFSFLPSCRKRTSFKKEREIRILANTSWEKWDSGNQNNNDPPISQLLQVRFDRLFEAVYVGPNSDNTTYQQIQKLADTAAGSQITRRSALTKTY
jgi:hypothetical protein